MSTASITQHKTYDSDNKNKCNYTIILGHRTGVDTRTLLILFYYYVRLVLVV